MTGLLSRSLIEATKDPAPAWMWMFSVIGVKDLPFLNPMYVTDIDFGFKRVHPETVLWGGKYVHFPSGPEPFPPLTMGLYEDHRYYSTSLLELWQQQALTKDNYAGLPKNYCGTGYLMAFDTMGYPVLEVTIKGMWPNDIGSLRFGQHSEPIRKVATFSYNELSIITEETVAHGLLDEVGLGGGLAQSLTQGVVGGGLTMVPGL